MVLGGLCCNLCYETSSTNDFLLSSSWDAVLSIQVRAVMTTTGRSSPMLDDVLRHCFQVWLFLLLPTYSTHWLSGWGKVVNGSSLHLVWATPAPAAPQQPFFRPKGSGFPTHFPAGSFQRKSNLNCVFSYKLSSLKYGTTQQIQPFDLTSKCKNPLLPSDLTLHQNTTVTTLFSLFSGYWQFRESPVQPAHSQKLNKVCRHPSMGKKSGAAAGNDSTACASPFCFTSGSTQGQVQEGEMGMGFCSTHWAAASKPLLSASSGDTLKGQLLCRLVGDKHFDTGKK